MPAVQDSEGELWPTGLKAPARQGFGERAGGGLVTLTLHPGMWMMGDRGSQDTGGRLVQQANPRPTAQSELAGTPGKGGTGSTGSPRQP